MWTSATILFAAYSGVAALLAITAGLRAAASGEDIGRAARAGILVTSIAILPAFACAALSTAPGLSRLWPAFFALPILALAGLASGVRLWGGLGFGGKLLVSTSVAWNGYLTLVYSLHVVTELLFIDLGLASSLPLAMQGLAQNVVGAPGAEAQAKWLWLPILLPPRRDGALALSSRVVAGALSSAMLGLTSLAIPAALDVVRQPDRQASNVEAAPRGDMKTSIRIGEDTWSHALDLFGSRQAEVEGEIARASKELGAREAVLSIRADLVEDETRMTRLANAAERVRKHGMRLTMRVTLPPAGAVAMHPRPFAEMMQKAHWIVMERVAPDLLVLFDRPMHSKTRAVAGSISSTKWIEIIRDSVRQIAEGKPRQRCAITLETSHPKSREIWMALASGRGPHEIRFRIEGARHDAQGPERACLTLEGWLAESKARVPITLVASAPPPVSFGGLRAMQSYYRTLLSTASKQSSIAKLCLGNLQDGPDGRNGLWTTAGRARPVVTDLYELLQRIGARRATPQRPGPR